MRLFIAIPLPGSIKATLQGIQQTLPEGIRRQPAEQMHITLRFLGEVSPDTANDIASKLNKIESAAFPLSLKGSGAFPQKGEPKIMWTGVEKNELLIKLQKKVESVCVSSGLEPEKREYIPHITLGRTKKASPKLVKKWIDEYKNWSSKKFSANHFALFVSQLRKEGATHKQMASYPLL